MRIPPCSPSTCVNDAREWIFGDRSRSVTGHSWAGGRWPLRVVTRQWQCPALSGRTVPHPERPVRIPFRTRPNEPTNHIHSRFQPPNPSCPPV